MTDILEKQLTILNRYMDQASLSLADKPAGCLQICKNKGTDQYYYRSSSSMKKGIYLSKDQMPLILALAQKSYDLKFLAAAKSLEARAIKSKKPIGRDGLHDLYCSLADVFQALPPSRKKLVNPYVLPDEAYYRSWISQRYEGKPFDLNMPRFLTEGGETVRSKSEKIIADKLRAIHIPYLYELPLNTKRLGIVYPDFTLLDIWNRETIILEHFGKMLEEGYFKHTLNKIETYEAEGRHLGSGFLFTMEANNFVLSMQYLESILLERIPHAGYFSFVC